MLKRILLSNAYLALAASLTLLAGCMTPSAPAGDNSSLLAKCEKPATSQELVFGVLALVNEARMAEGVEPLTMDETLSAVADEFACEMLELDFFGHENPFTKVGPGERLNAAGYIFFAMGENLGVGQPTAMEVFNDWMASPLHRANILSPEWRETGIAVRTGGTYQWYWVQEFADPLE